MMLKMKTRLLDGVVVLECSGRIVFGEETKALRERVKQLLGETNEIVLDLAEVSYIDSGGLGTLVGLHSSARNIGAHIKMASLTPRVGDLLQVTKLVTVFDVYDQADLAVRDFRKRAIA
jgi:anti-sigma B factor antagonist